MKKWIFLAATLISIYPACGTMKSTARIVDPVGPIVVSGGGQTVTQVTETAPGVGTAVVAPTGASATVVDPETGEVVSASVGLPVGVAVVGGGVAATTTTTVVTGPEVTCGMSYDNHASLLNSLRKVDSFEQVDLVKQVAGSNQITSDQAVAVLYTLPDDFTRMDAAEAMYPVICDPENWFRVNDTFDFPSSRDDLRKRLGMTSGD